MSAGLALWLQPLLKADTGVDGLMAADRLTFNRSHRAQAETPKPKVIGPTSPPKLVKPAPGTMGMENEAPPNIYSPTELANSQWQDAGGGGDEENGTSVW